MCHDVASDAISPLKAWHGRRALLAVLAIALLVSFTGIFDHSLWRPDEPRVANIGYEMLKSNDYIVPRVLGEPFLEKPPLYWWGMTVLYRVFGVSAGVARMTSALASVVLLILVFDLCRRLADPFAGLVATIIVASTAAFYDLFHSVLVDTWLTLFVFLGYWAFVYAEFDHKGEEADAPHKPRALGIFLIYLAGGLAFLCKGAVGPILIAGPIGLTILIGRRWRVLFSWAHIPGILTLGALCAIWPILLYQRGGKELLDGFLIHNLVYRIHPSGDGSYTGGHVKPFWYYFKGSCVASLLPWAVALPSLIYWLWKKRVPEEWNRRGILFVTLIFPVGVLLLSIPQTKRQLYVSPLQVPMAAMLGVWIAAQVRQGASGWLDRFTQFILVGVPALAGALLIPAGLGALILSHCNLPEMVIGDKDISTIIRTVPHAVYIIASLLGVLFLGQALWGIRLWRRNSNEAMVVAARLALTVAVLGCPLMFIAQEPFNSLRALPQGLEEECAFSQELIVYRLDEVGRSIIAFETEQMPRPETDPIALRESLEQTHGANLLLLDPAQESLPPDIQMQLKLVRVWPFSKRRTYNLYTIKSAVVAEVSD